MTLFFLFFKLSHSTNHFYAMMCCNIVILKETSRKPQEPSFDMTEHAYFTSGENLPPEDLNDHY